MHVKWYDKNPLVGAFELRNSPPDVAQDVSSRIERARINSNHGDPIVPASKRRKVSLKKQSWRRMQMLSAKRPGIHVVVIVIIHYIHLSTE